MARNFGLALSENLNEVADAKLSPVHEIEKAQTRAIRKRGKQQIQGVDLREAIHVDIIYALTDMFNREYIRFGIYEEKR